MIHVGEQVHKSLCFFMGKTLMIPSHMHHESPDMPNIPRCTEHTLYRVVFLLAKTAHDHGTYDRLAHIQTKVVPKKPFRVGVV